MFSTLSLFFSFRRPVPRPEDIDPWNVYRSWYVTQYRAQFERIADILTDATHTVSVSLNLEQACAEFKDQTGWIVARVKVRGELGMSYEAIVRTMLTSDRREIFTEHLPLRVHFRGW